MGYTHSWRRPVHLPPSQFAQAMADCEQILPQLNTPLAGPNGEGKPIFSPDRILFNGAGPASCESFAILLNERDRGDGQPIYAFCKTEYLPYDLALQVVLIVFKHYMGSQFQVTSDGHDAAWETACRQCQQLLGYGGDFKLDPKT